MCAASFHRSIAYRTRERNRGVATFSNRQSPSRLTEIRCLKLEIDEQNCNWNTDLEKEMKFIHVCVFISSTRIEPERQARKEKVDVICQIRSEAAD
ncbi:hypothetical protein L1887_31511 [Cichorium endivia]|nr:hypothetical protein L1887_31511 [Cichorium endivia]